MKFALVIKGLSYVKELNYYNERAKEPHSISFEDSIQSFEDKVINPLRENGHSVDIFFNTNTSDKVDSFIQRLKPCKVILYEYNNKGTTWDYINNLILQGLILVKEHNKDNYDYIIVTRFDIFIFENILNLFKSYIPEVGISTIAPNNDCFFIFNGQLLDKLIQIFYWMTINIKCTHSFTVFAQINNIIVHSFYNYTGVCTKESTQNPFYRVNRYIFVPKDHYWYHHSIEECFDPNSKHYAFQCPINTEYKSGTIIL